MGVRFGHGPRFESLRLVGRLTSTIPERTPRVSGPSRIKSKTPQEGRGDKVHVLALPIIAKSGENSLPSQCLFTGFPELSAAHNRPFRRRMQLRNRSGSMVNSPLSHLDVTTCCSRHLRTASRNFNHSVFPSHSFCVLHSGRIA